MKKSILACVGSVLLSMLSPAFAADMPIKGVAPYIAPYYNWSGFYVGINGGYGFGSSTWTDPATTITTGSFSVSGPVIGGTLGYNYQMGAIVFGLEGDYGWSNIKGSTTTNCPGGCETKNSWLATARVRLGYAFDRWLPYVTGGAAFGDIKATTLGAGGGTSTSSKTGWTAGGGVEWAFFSNWTAKFEYLYVDLGTGSCSGACAGGGGPIDVTFKTHLVRAGINYRF